MTDLQIKVDARDRHLLRTYHFTLKNKRGKWYAETKVAGRTVGLHRLVLGVDDPTIIVDHVDRDGLNNRRRNLRAATKSQNAANVAPRSGCSSAYKGVDRRGNRWRARVMLSGRYVHLGLFERERDAAAAYDHAVLEHFGEFAVTNVISHARWAKQKAA